MLSLEDLTVGQRFSAGPLAPIALDDIKAFANQFDPQPFHVDAAAAPQTFFGEIVASGWHTASLTMRLLVEAIPLAHGLIGAAVDELRWPTPVRPGDALRVDCSVLDIRRSASRPDRAFVRVAVETRNARDDVVQSMTTTVIAFGRDRQFGR